MPRKSKHNRAYIARVKSGSVLVGNEEEDEDAELPMFNASV